VFAIEIEACRRCGGKLRVIRASRTPLIERILSHLEQPPEDDPPRSPFAPRVPPRPLPLCCSMFVGFPSSRRFKVSSMGALQPPTACAAISLQHGEKRRARRFANRARSGGSLAGSGTARPAAQT